MNIRPNKVDPPKFLFQVDQQLCEDVADYSSLQLLILYIAFCNVCIFNTHSLKLCSHCLFEIYVTNKL